jgi:prephenate dehydrogenase
MPTPSSPSRGYDPARGKGLRIPGRAAHDGRQRKRRTAASSRPLANSWVAAHDGRAFRQDRADRHRPSSAPPSPALSRSKGWRRTGHHLQPQPGDAATGPRNSGSAPTTSPRRGRGGAWTPTWSVVSVPVGASAEVARQIAPQPEAGAIVTDVGSTKASVVAQMLPHMPQGVHFIPGHPLAGTETFRPGCRLCAEPVPRPLVHPHAGARHRQGGKREARRLLGPRSGSKVDEMDTEHHDKVLAIVSHLPHIIAYNIVGTADDLETVTESEVIKYSASGFRDFTRLAASDPTMWRDVCLHNKDAILEMLARFSEDLAYLQRAIRWGDGRQSCSTSSPAPRHPPLDHRCRPGRGCSRLWTPCAGR